MLKRLSLLAVPFLLLGVSGAQANTYTFTFSDGATTLGLGTLDATSIGGDQYLATSGSGLIFSSTLTTSPDAITLIPVGPAVTYSPSGAFIVDDVLYPAGDAQSSGSCAVGATGGYLDNCGLLFTFTDNGSPYELNIWGNGSGGGYSVYTYQDHSSYVVQSGSGTFTLTADNIVAATPEPTFYAALAIGFIGLVAVIRRRSNA